MTSKEREAIKVREAVEKFVGDGGIIKKIPYGPDLHPRSGQTRYHFADPAKQIGSSLELSSFRSRISQYSHGTIHGLRGGKLRSMIRNEQTAIEIAVAKRHKKLTTL